MPQNLENSTTHSSNSSTKTWRPPPRPMVTKPTGPHQLPNKSHPNSSGSQRFDSASSIWAHSTAGKPPLGAAMAGSSKSEDHDPNLEDLTRVNRPPVVIPMISIAQPRNPRRRFDSNLALKYAGAEQAREGREGREENGRFNPYVSFGNPKHRQRHSVRALDRHSEPNKRGSIPARAPETILDLSNNEEKYNPDMDVDEIDAFNKGLPKTFKEVLERLMESPAKSAPSRAPSFLTTNTTDIDCLGITSDPSNRHPQSIFPVGHRNSQHTPILGEGSDLTDANSKHLNHTAMNYPQPESPVLAPIHENRSEQTQLSQTPRIAENGLPSFPYSTFQCFTSQTSDSMVPSNLPVKEEPALSPTSPIDVDLPLPSLYDQLGLPNQTSGALRVPRPQFDRDEKEEKERWSREMVDSIRWVRGRDGSVPPLVVGKILWRSDGVSFDWMVPPEELLPRVGTPVHLRSSHANNLDHTTGQQQSTSTKIREGFTAPAPATGDTTSALPVKEEAIEISLPPTEALLCRARSTDIKDSAVVSGSPQTMNSSRLVNDTGSHAESPSNIDQIFCSNNARNSISLPEMAQSLPINSAFDSADSLSNIATCFLDRYTRCFDQVKSRSRLSGAYTEDALMSIQFNDLPSEGTCPRVGQPKKQSHAIVDFADREVGRNLLLDSDRDPKDRQFQWRTKSSLVIGSQAITSRLATFESLSHTPSPSSSRTYRFSVAPLKEFGLLLLEYSGDLYATKASSGERYLSLRFHRTFIMRSNEPDSASWIDWPWVITNDQMTLFHRHGIVCQCPT